jgi:hypothetical protein
MKTWRPLPEDGRVMGGRRRSAAIGPCLAGRIFDVTGSYTLALWIGLAMAVVSPVVLWVVGPRHPNPPLVK